MSGETSVRKSAGHGAETRTGSNPACGAETGGKTAATLPETDAVTTGPEICKHPKVTRFGGLPDFHKLFCDVNLA